MKDVNMTGVDYEMIMENMGIDGRLKEGLRAKMGLHPFQEEQCHNFCACSVLIA